MPVRPLGRRLIVRKPEAGHRESPGGIVIPRSSIFDRVLKGEVVAQGDVEGQWIGREVWWPQYAGVSFEEGAEAFVIVHMGDVMAVNEEDRN